ncbi:MAG: GNAT family N-acetyltransferase [Acidimicrobiia bacterium]
MVQVQAYDDPATVLEVSGAFLATEPVRHNLMLTLLRRCATTGDAGRFWVVLDDGPVVGVAFQSPLHYYATLTPMAPAAAEVLAATIAQQGVELPGINAEVAAAAAFAGRWTEVARVGARPVEGMRLYDVDVVVDPTRPTPGFARRVTVDDRDLAVEWAIAFEHESGVVGAGDDLGHVVDRRIAAGELWVWDHEGPVSFLGVSAPIADAVRIGPVYTPADLRGLGYASALVAASSRAARADGLRCLLYTDLNNPQSNSIYRALGYRSVAELTRYEFRPTFQ